MRSNRRSLLLSIILGLSLGVSCTPGDFTTEVSLDPSDATLAQPSGTGDLKVSPVSADLLVCDPQTYLSSTRLVGPKGGRIKVGSHVLSIPAGALSQDITIVAEQVVGSTNSVRFSPDGLKFARPAVLTMSYNNCMTVAADKSIVYTTEQLGIIELLPSVDKSQSRAVTTEIDHFSRYAVAY
jgi:hypothetical protein